jgi:uncharacterized protein (DUF1800 family)
MLKSLAVSKWNYATAAHLYSRAGFGGTPEEIEKLAAMSPSEAVAYFVEYEKIPDLAASPPDWAKPNPELAEQQRNIQRMFRDDQDSSKTEEEKRAEAEKRRQMVQQIQRNQIKDLQEMCYNWLTRMATGPRPFQEKLTLFWHGHFATSAVKVRDAYYMWLQIDTFRRKGSGNWLDLLEATATDPAMLIWLDQAQSRRQHPNENFARECMELFALGEGHYTEKDVTEAARAMTGWSMDRFNQEYVYRPRIHDDGIKTVLGKTGNLDGRDVLETIVAQPQAARFITGKLWKFFASENPDPKLIDALADEFRGNGNNFAPFLRALFSSEEFYSDAVMRTQVKSPVQWLVGTVRLLQRDLPPPLVATQMIKTLGQDLLLPPNVKGWDGGLSWITTNTLLARYNQAAILIMGQGNLGANGDRPGLQRIAERANEMARNLRPADVAKIINEEDRGDHQAVIARLEKRFIQGQLSEKHRQVLRDYLGGRTDLNDQDIRHAVRLLMSTPEYQVT